MMHILQHIVKKRIIRRFMMHFLQDTGKKNAPACVLCNIPSVQDLGELCFRLKSGAAVDTMRHRFAGGGSAGMAVIKIGQPVPDFTLPASNGKQVSLRDFRGSKVVLFFYPKDSTPTCTAESCDFRDNYARFAAADAAVIGISPDDLKSHARFIAKHELPFLLLSDTDHAVCELFGVWQEKSMYGRKYMGVVRSTFLIDEAGVLLREWRKVKVKGHVEEVLAAVNQGR
jgi:peroxiredoxin Q/BCP